MEGSKIKTLLRHIKYRLVLKFKPRQNRVYTQFYRFPNQYKALVERIIPRYQSTAETPLDIVMFACCSGAEAFSLSKILQENFPTLRFRIRAFDIVEEVIQQAHSGTFSKDEVYASPFITEDFVATAFTADKDDNYQIKPHIAEPVEFAVGDMLDKSFIESLGKFDLVIAQNVLFHLPQSQSRIAFAHLCDLLKRDSTLFINGMDTDMRIKLTKLYKLQPLEYLIEEIHNDARVDRGAGWAGAYWGREPFSRNAKEWIRKHCTIYIKE